LIDDMGLPLQRFFYFHFVVSRASKHLRLIDGEHTVVFHHYAAADERRANGKARPKLNDEQKTQKRDEASPPEV
jgi:hypothetical protein